MKSSAFDYVRAQTPQQVFDLLAQHGDGVRLLAGGQTLLAALNMRLSEPALVVDIGGLAALRGISVVDSVVDSGPAVVLRLGALTRHVEIEESPLVAQHAPLLTQAAPHIAHRAIRNRGTLGGSLAYADPAAEWPACALALDATLVLQSALGERRVAAADFFQGLYTTARRDDEILTAMEVPLPAAHAQAQERHHFIEVARRHGDYAVVGLAARAQWAGGRLSQVRLAFLSVADRPWRARQTESVLEAGPFDVARLAAADAALRAELKPMADLTHSEAGKRQIAATLMRRAVSAITSA
jgi:aerobic carbon-monoxide dehydrogenase medium subunit